MSPAATTSEPGASSLAAVRRDLAEHADPAQAEFCLRYFRTGPGEYGEGDRFLGIRAPELRALARKHTGLSLTGCRALLRSRDHEARLLALLIMARAYERGDDEARDAIYFLYLDSTDRINNWDLVDCSAPHIVGRHLEDRSRAVLTKLARSKSLWERRIAIIATQHFIRQGDFADALRVADILLDDPHDLIHKAVGWMVREVGNRDRAAEEAFLRPRYQRMPRTMLRYAIEKFPEPLRKRYLRGEA
jgi:3-methyladenine DNA glycosylase AlkD